MGAGGQGARQGLVLHAAPRGGPQGDGPHRAAAGACDLAPGGRPGLRSGRRVARSRLGGSLGPCRLAEDRPCPVSLPGQCPRLPPRVLSPRTIFPLGSRPLGTWHPGCGRAAKTQGFKTRPSGALGALWRGLPGRRLLRRVKGAKRRCEARPGEAPGVLRGATSRWPAAPRSMQGGGVPGG